ncbi:hypothetical protein B0H15DRAFT_31724 [Mycena belliarum]|uniref:F-box domain-containing protein n=1 Tax=Mycena belliarum TaxID=1033014 RepID=A0AAD6UD59_9AGAR|nr:hypothetical protein B0H15DRAFT_31724 [Mycena belliae]
MADIPLALSPNFCGPPIGLNTPGYESPRPLVTLKSLLSDRALTVKRPRQQPPSLIFRLPAEMLAEIFLKATEDQEVSTTGMKIPMRSHLVLSHVCALWRAVALYTPSLWCRVVLHLGSRTTGFSSITTLARTCFVRSCELPLALIITSSAKAETIPNLSMDLVLPVRHRIRHLELTLPAVFTESIFKLPKKTMKALRTISVTALVPDEPVSWFHAMSALAGAPLLHSVKLSCAPAVGPLRWTGVRLDPFAAGLPWEQLTELHLQDLVLCCADAIYALKQTTHLLRCSLDIDIPEALGPVPLFPPLPGLSPSAAATPRIKTPVTLPALLTLHLTVSGWDGATSELLDRFILPSLTDLSIINKESQLLPCTALTALQTRSSFSLERFVLAHRMGDSLLPFLQTNPHLTRLLLVSCGLKLAPLAAALTLETGVPPLLPRLRALALSDSWRDAAPRRATKAALNMARSRRHVPGDTHGTAQLRTLTFGSQVEHSAARVARWPAEGMRVRVVRVPASEGPWRAQVVRADLLGLGLDWDWEC